MLYPEIYSGGDRVAILNNITKNKNTRRINNKFIFDFECYEEEFKTDHIIDTNQIHIGNKYFDMKYIEVVQKTDIKYKVQCEHVFYRLIKGDSIVRYANTGTPTEILNDLLIGTDFSVGTVEFLDQIVFSVNKTASKMNIILALIESLGGEIDFDGFNINLLNSIGQDNGYSIRVGKNLKGITKIIDKRGVDKLIYKIDLENIFKCDEFKRLGLEDLEKVDIGDTVKVVSNAIGVDVSLKVLELSKDVIDSRNLVVTLSDTLDLINDDIYNDKINTVRKDEVYYGVKINNEVGLETERSDLLARSIFNADEFKMQIGDGFGAYTDAVYFNPATGKYIFEGDIDASGTITGAEIIGSSINNGSGTFEVDVAGNVIAESLTINGGAINSANIDISENITVGNFIFVGFTGTSASKGLRFDGTNAGLLTDASENMSLTSRNDLQIGGDGIDVNCDSFDVTASSGSVDIIATTGISLGIGGVSTPDFGGMNIDLNGDFQLDTPGYIDLISNNSDIALIANSGDVILSPSGRAYYGIPTSSDEIVVQGDISNFITESFANTTYCQNESSNNMSFQIFSGALEVFENGSYQFTLNP